MCQLIVCYLFVESWVLVVESCLEWSQLAAKLIGRSPRQGFLDLAFMLHCTILPQTLAHRGICRVPLAPTAVGVLVGSI